MDRSDGLRHAEKEAEEKEVGAVIPLTKKGRKIKRAMIRTYGKTKGTRVFYAYENKHRGIAKRRRRRKKK